MRTILPPRLAALALGAFAVIASQAAANPPPAAGHGHAHGHAHEADHGHAPEHAHDHAQENMRNHGPDAVRKGHFDDTQVQPRLLGDWEGDWQSVYPHLIDGTLDPVMAHKAEHGDRSAAAFREEYEAGYRTDVDRIRIDGDLVTFHRGAGVVSGRYAPDGHEILTYEKGNRGVRYVFRKTAGDAAAPGFIQFSDHRIAPEKSGHFHLYWGDDRAALLSEVTHWPTYYPAALTGAEIAREMMAH